MASPSSDFELLASLAEVLAPGTDPLPVAVQRLLEVVEAAWAPVRASVDLGGSVHLVTGRSEFAAGGPVTEIPLGRGPLSLGTLRLERPALRPEPFPAAILPVLSLVLSQEIALRRPERLAEASPELVGNSGVMEVVLRRLDAVAPSLEPVLLVGEPGVGKQRLAEAIHRRSSRAGGPFVAFSGSGLPDPMVEGELLGIQRKSGGRWAEAVGGTLFLDEVADLSPAVQGRLVRLLAEKGPQPRLIASTRHALEGRVAAGRFRPDLLAQLEVQRIVVPPLRDRGSDIIALADHFVMRFSLRTGKTVKRISTPALEMLLTYPWPGNVRELETVLERAVLLSDDEVIHGYHLPPSLQSSVHSGTQMHGRLQDRLDSLEYEMLVEALKSSKGNMTQAGRELGLTKRLMGLRMAKYELDYRTFRQGTPALADEDDWN